MKTQKTSTANTHIHADGITHTHVDGTTHTHTDGTTHTHADGSEECENLRSLFRLLLPNIIF